MNKWYDKYLSIYDRPFDEVPDELITETRQRLAALQSNEPLLSIVVIAYNEEKHLMACLWALSEIQCSYPVEIIGVDNDSCDRTAEIFERLGITYFTEHQHSCGYARRRGLQEAKGTYYFCTDADTLYPPHYYDVMMKALTKPNVVAASATWSYFPTEKHSAFSLSLFCLCRDLFLWAQHFRRPELSVRGLVMAYHIPSARKEEYRVDIKRGEDGSMALSLKKYGQIAFVRNSQAKAITGYGTLGNDSLWKSLIYRIKVQGKGILRIFYSTDHYEDTQDNLVK